MKKLFIYLIILSFTISCASRIPAKITITSDNKYATYEVMQLIKAIEVKSIGNDKIIFPAQNLKLVFAVNDWKYYRAENQLPNTKILGGLCINANNEMATWIDNPMLHLTERDMKNVKYKIIQITEKI
jgi:hypothetical protein